MGIFSDMNRDLDVKPEKPQKGFFTSIVNEGMKKPQVQASEFDPNPEASALSGLFERASKQPAKPEVKEVTPQRQVNASDAFGVPDQTTDFRQLNDVAKWAAGNDPVVGKLKALDAGARAYQSQPITKNYSFMSEADSAMQKEAEDAKYTEQQALFAMYPTIASALPELQAPVGVIEKIGRGTVGSFAETGLGAAQAISEAVRLPDGVGQFFADAGKRAREFGEAPLDNPHIQGFSKDSIVQGLRPALAGAGTSIATNLPALAANFFAPGSGLPLMAAQVGAGEYSKGRADGLGGESAAIRGALMGLLEAAGEKIGGFDKVSGGIKKAVTDQSLFPIGKAMMQSGMRETPGELFTTATQYATDALPVIGTNKNPSFNELGRELKDTAVTTLLQSAGMVGGGKVLQKAANSDFAKKREVSRDMQNALAGEFAISADQVALNRLNPANAQITNNDVKNNSVDERYKNFVHDPAKPHIKPEAQAPDAPAQEQAAQAKPEQAPVIQTEKPVSMFEIIKQNGGIKATQLRQDWGLSADQIRALPPGVATDKGMLAKDMAAKLSGLGYIEDQDFQDLFDGEMRGNAHYTPEGYQQVYQAELTSGQGNETQKAESVTDKPDANVHAVSEDLQRAYLQEKKEINAAVSNEIETLPTEELHRRLDYISGQIQRTGSTPQARDMRDKIKGILNSRAVEENAIVKQDQTVSGGGDDGLAAASQVARADQDESIENSGQRGIFSHSVNRNSNNGILWSESNDQSHAKRVARAAAIAVPGRAEYRYTVVEPAGNSNLESVQGSSDTGSNGQAQVSKKFTGRVKELEKALGRKVVFVRPEGDSYGSYHGLVITNTPTTIYVNPNASVSIEAVVGHEFYEGLKLQNPRLHDWFAWQASLHLKEGGFEKYTSELHELGYKEELFKEMLADFTGDALTDPSFQQRLFNQDQSKFKALYRGFIQFLNKILDRIRGKQSGLTGNTGYGTDSVFNDVQGLRDSLIQVIRDAESGKFNETRSDSQPLFSRKVNPDVAGVANDTFATTHNAADSNDDIAGAGDDSRTSQPNDNPNILFSRSRKLTADERHSQQKLDMPLLIPEQSAFDNASSFEVSDPGRVDAVIRAMQDSNVDIKRLQQAIRATGAEINESSDVYLNDELYVRRLTHQLDELNSKHVTPLLQKIMDSKLDIDSVEEYLYARHAPERNAQMEKINPDREDNKALSGMSNERAAEIMAKYAKNIAMHDISKMVDEITKETRRRLKSSGLEEASTIAQWEAAYRYYVPLNRDGTKNILNKRAMGGTSEAKNILANIIGQAQSSISRSEKARVKRSLLDLAREFPNPEFWKVDEAPNKKAINKKTGLVEIVADPLFKYKDNVLVVKENGKEHFIVFNENNERAMEIAKSMQNIDAARAQLEIKLIGSATRFLAQWMTTRNPLFWVTNFARDIQHATFNLADTPISGKAPEMMSNILPAMKGYWQITRGDGKGKWADAAREFQKYGGETGFSKNFDSPEKHMADLERQLKEMQQSKADPRKMARKTIEFIEGYNDIVENGVRLAVYQTGRDNGMSQRAAASMAANITVNFNRRGNKTGTYNALWMFMNANIQGHARMLSALKNSKKARFQAAAMVSISFALTVLNHALSKDDEETGKPKYELIPEWEKEKNWLFMMPSGTYFKLPFAQGLDVFMNVGRLLADSIFAKDKKSPIEMASTMAKVMIDTFNPFGSANIGDALTPSIARPVVQAIYNRTHTGAPMYKEADKRGYIAPSYQRAYRSTGEHWIAASKILNDIAGGDSIKPGLIDIPPEAIRHIITSYVAPGVSQVIDKAATTGMKAYRGEKIEPSQIPGLSRFYGEAPEERTQMRAYYDESNRVKQLVEQEKKYRKAGEHDKARETMAELGDGNPAKGKQIANKFEQTGDHLAGLGNRRNQIDKRDGNEDRKREILAKIDSKRLAIMQRTLKKRSEDDE